MAEVSPLKRLLLRYLWVFPLVAGSAWFLTLSILLIHWLAAGRPRYPGQSNPYVAYISDIAAFEYKPVFIAGCTITALAFAVTVFAVHYARYSVHFYGLTGDARWRKMTSIFTLLCGLWAATSLLLLTVFDTFHAHQRHGVLLLSCFGGLLLAAFTTTVVWFDQAWKPSDWEGLRKWCLASNAWVVIDIAVGVAFTVLVYSSWMRTAGILEWALTYAGAFWLLTFAGYLKDIATFDDDDVNEERRLLGADD